MEVVHAEALHGVVAQHEARQLGKDVVLCVAVGHIPQKGVLLRVSEAVDDAQLREPLPQQRVVLHDVLVLAAEVLELLIGHAVVSGVVLYDA